MKNINILLGCLIVIVAFVFALPSTSNAQAITRQLQEGMSGSDVSVVQTFLAQDRTLYPQGLVTGYFGPLTRSAVSNFQARNGISAVGRIGPITLPVINAQIAQGLGYGNNSGIGGRAPTITGVAVNANDNDATLSWSTDESAKGIVYYSTNPLVLIERLNSVDVVGANTAMIDSNLHTSQNMEIGNLSSNTTYHYMVYVTDRDGNVSVSWPSTFRTDN